MALNGISTLPTKQARQLAKLDIAQARRQGYPTVVENTTAYSIGTDFNLGDIKITVNNVDGVYLHFYNSVPAISDLITVGMRVTIDWDGRPGNTVADIASPLIDFPGHTWRPGGLGFLLSIVTTTELPGNSEDYNIDGLHVPNGRFSGSGSPTTTATYYRSRNVYDIDLLADKYTSNTTTVMTTSTLVEGRPWLTGVSEIVTDGLVLHYDFSDPACYPGTGTEITDLSNATNTGTVVNSYDHISYVSSGTNSYFNWDSPQGANGLGSSIHAAKQNTYRDFTMVFQPNFGSGFGGLFAMTTDQSLRVYDGNTWILPNPGNGNDWAYPSATTFYINGQVANQAVSGWNIMGGAKTSGNFPEPSNFYLGTSGYDNRHMQGKIALVLMYNRVLTEQEQLQNYNSLKARFGL